MDFDDLPRVRSTREQVADAVSILVQQLQPGDQLPPEPELARSLGVSRPTLREVLKTFVERGLLLQRQGVGTFVASRLPILETGLEVLESLERMAEHRGLVTEMAHLRVVERDASEMELTGLGTPGPTRVLAVDRVIAMEGEPVADLLDVVPVDVLRSTDLDDRFRGSVLDLLLERGTPGLTISRTEIMATSADERLGHRLRVPPGAALLRMMAQLFGYDGRVVDFSISTFVPGHFRFHVIRQVRTS